MSLPIDILISRLRNELTICSRYLRHPVNTSEENLSRFPLDIEIELVKVPGSVLQDGKVVTRYNHSFSIIVTREYPFEKPLVIWRTPIFHPNIMMPEDGGHLCTKLLEEWNFNSTLLSFIKGIESLLLTPNPRSPFGTDSCTGAADHFNNGHQRIPPVVYSPQPKVVRSR
jgi:ubiquitin-protein ligase